MSMEYNRLQTIMNEKDITYRELARMTGVSIGTLHKIANFQQSPTQKVMIAIARGLQMEVTEIFNLEWRK